MDTKENQSKYYSDDTVSDEEYGSSSEDGEDSKVSGSLKKKKSTKANLEVDKEVISKSSHSRFSSNIGDLEDFE